MVRSVLITGCSSGIGEYCAKALHVNPNYRVFATARKEEDVARLQAEGLWACVLDLDDSSSIEGALERVLQETDGTLDVLFNNGAYGQPGAVEDLSREALKAQFETNVFGTQELSNKVLKVMRAQGQGRIIHNSSVLGFVAMPYRGAYNASKYALEGLSDTLRLELAGSDIHVVLIEPGPIRSKFRENALKMFKKNIDVMHSAHKKEYNETLKRLQATGDSSFTLGPEAVLDALMDAMESARPRPRYPVTTPTKVLWYLKRVLPVRWLDGLLRKVD